MTAECKVEVSEVNNTERFDVCANEAVTKIFFVPTNIETLEAPLFASTLPTVTKLVKT